MELSPLPTSERAAQAKDDNEEEDEVDMLISDNDYSTDLEVEQIGDFDLSSDIKPPPRWTCCGEISAGTLLRRLGYVCVVVVVLVAFFAMFTIPTPPEFGGITKAVTSAFTSPPNASSSSSIASSSSSSPVAVTTVPNTPSSPPTFAAQPSEPAPAIIPGSPSQGELPSFLAPIVITVPTAVAISPSLALAEAPAPSPSLPESTVPSPRLTESTVPSPVSTTTDAQAVQFDRKEMRQLAARLKPRDWNVSNTPKQFLHMHHMKTGGTSMDGLLSCAISRWRTLTGKDLRFYRVSECSGGVARCTNSLARNDTSSCPVHAAAVMSYCASLDAVDRFGWGAADKFTILRDPVDRVWSMYRYSLQGCYSCKTLPEVFQELDNNVTYSGVCGSQLLNHQTENMLSADTRAREAHLSEQELIDEAIKNMNSRFAVIGLTGRYLESVKMITKVFPFMSKNLTETTNGQINDTVTCSISHANEGRAPTCGTRALDDNIRKIIIDHNKRDVQLYAAALIHFEKQKKILLDNEVYDDEDDATNAENESNLESAIEYNADEGGAA